MKERRDNFIEEESTVSKKFKPNTEEEAPVKACPMRRKGAADDEECLACGS